MTKPVSDKLLRYLPQRGICLVLGSEGSGKSVLAFGIIESLKDTGRPIGVSNFPLSRATLLPDWCTVFTTDKYPDDAIVLVDEAYIPNYSRDFNRTQNKDFDRFSGLVRQKGLLAIYVSQFARKVDIGLASSPRCLLIKQPSLLQMKMDRSSLRPILADADRAFRKLETQLNSGEVRRRAEEIKEKFHQLGADTEVDPLCLISTYVVSNRFEGMIENSNSEPSFWSKELSRAWKDVDLETAGAAVGYGFGRGTPTLCVECDSPAVGICTCCGSSLCADHAQGHKMGKGA